MRLAKYLFCFVPILLASNSVCQKAPVPGSSLKKPLIYQIGQAVHINATGPRPLLQAIDALQEKYGWVMDYEDPQYPPTIQEAPTPPGPVRRHPMTRNSDGAGFSVQFNAAPTPDSRPDEPTILALIVDANNQNNDAGQFELRTATGASFAVVGVGVRDANGQDSTQSPILDSLISLKAERRTVGEPIALICEKVSQQGKIKVTANGSTESGSITVGGTAIPARTLLSSTLASLGSNSFWRLLYDPNEKSYQLSVNRGAASGENTR